MDLIKTIDNYIYIGVPISKNFVFNIDEGFSFGSGWKYKKLLHIKGSTGAGNNYPVLLKIGESSTASNYDFHLDGNSDLFPSDINDSGDIRFIKSDSTTSLSFWVEKVEGTSPNRTAYVWVKVEDNLDNDVVIYCYYGNDKANNVSNGDNTFEFFDDFEGTNLDTNKWAKQGNIGSSATVQNNKLILSAGQNNNSVLIESLVDINLNSYVLETEGKVRNDYGVGQYRPGILWKHTRGDFTDLYAFDTYAFSHNAWVVFKKIGNSYTNLGEQSGANIFLTDTYSGRFHLKIIINGNTYIAKELLRNKIVTVTDSQLTDKSVGLLTEKCENEYYYFLVRKYVSPEPAFSSVEN